MTSVTFTASNGTPAQDATLVADIVIAAQTGLTFTYNLPAAQVGKTYNGSIGVERQPNCSGNFSIAASAGVTLPPGLSWGAVTQIDNQNASIAVTGTPTTEGTASGITVDATDGVQSATSAVQSITVGAASSFSLVDVQCAPNVASSGAGASVTLANVQQGDLIAGVLEYITTQPTWPLSFTDTSGNAYSQDYDVWGGAGVGDIHAFHAVAQANATNLVVNAKFVGHSFTGTLTVYQYRGANTTITWLGQSFTSLQPAGPIASQPYTVQAGSGVIAAGTTYINGGITAFQASAAQALVQDTPGVNYDASRILGAWHYTANAAASEQVVSFSAIPSTSWRLGYVIGVVNPA